MAFSMFMRNTATISPMLKQQMMRLATQPCLLNQVILPASSKQAFVTPLSSASASPIYNAVQNRTLRTSPVPMGADTRMPHNEHPHNHAKLWIVEKSVMASMLVILPVALAFPCKQLDILSAIVMTAHSHWGLEAIAVDYVRESVVGPVLPKIALGLVYALTICTLGGLFYLIGHDEGIANTIRNLWAIKSEQNA